MAIEPERGCGYRKLEKFYLVGDYRFTGCDRLPMEVGACPVCGSGVHFSRNIAEIHPYQLWGDHTIQEYYPCGEKAEVGIRDIPCNCHQCPVCQPPETGYIMMVGEKFYPTPDDFINEAKLMGISKRIPSIPKNLKLGETVVYLAHKKGAEARVTINQQGLFGDTNGQGRLLEEEKRECRLGVFASFIPQRIETLVKKSKLTPRKREELEKRGITPIEVPDDDEDHR